MRCAIKWHIVDRFMGGVRAQVEKGMVLVIEDEPLVRELIEEALNDVGYRAIGIGSGGEAMLLLDHPPEGIDALICDIRLGGGISGWVVARHARTMMPDVGVIYISGDGGLDWEAEAVPGSCFVRKPFSGRVIVTAITTLPPPSTAE
jgi:DNA-binding NtrC family response regulator